MTIKTVLHKLADEMNRPHWHAEIDEEDTETNDAQDARYDQRYQEKAPVTAPAQDDITDPEAVEFEGTAKPKSLGGGSSKDGETTDGNG